MTASTQPKHQPVRYKCFIANPYRIVMKDNRVTVFTLPLDPTGSAFDRVDIFNALLTTYVVKKSDRSTISRTPFKTALLLGGGLTLYVVDQNSDVRQFVNKIESSRTAPLLTPQGALILHAQLNNRDRTLGLSLGETPEEPNTLHHHSRPIVGGPYE